jgi:hypothetical protein
MVIGLRATMSRPIVQLGIQLPDHNVNSIFRRRCRRDQVLVRKKPSDNIKHPNRKIGASELTHLWHDRVRAHEEFNRTGAARRHPLL